MIAFHGRGDFSGEIDTFRLSQVCRSAGKKKRDSAGRNFVIILKIFRA